MSEVATPPTTAPAAPAAPVSPASQESLFSAAPAAPAPPAAPAAPAAPADELAWLPEKYRVNGTDGTLDMAASSKKLGEGYAAAVKRIGTGDLAPDSPDGYKYTPPEAYKDIQLDPELNKSFRDRAHKAGLSNSQFEFVMGEYFTLVPALLDGKAKATAAEARTELQKVWADPSDMNRNMAAAEQAVAKAPESLRQAVKEKYGTDPLFWQFAAHYGKQLTEDRPPANPGTSQQPNDADALMRHPAYGDPKHPEHKAISQRVADIHRARYGEAPVN